MNVQCQKIDTKFSIQKIDTISFHLFIHSFPWMNYHFLHFVYLDICICIFFINIPTIYHLYYLPFDRYINK